MKVIFCTTLQNGVCTFVYKGGGIRNGIHTYFDRATSRKVVCFIFDASGYSKGEIDRAIRRSKENITAEDIDTGSIEIIFALWLSETQI